MALEDVVCARGVRVSSVDLSELHWVASRFPTPSDVSFPRFPAGVGWEGIRSSLGTYTDGRSTINVVRHREDGDGPERARDPLRSAALRTRLAL